MQTLLDFGDYPEIYSDGIGQVTYIGHHAHLLLFRWKRIDGIWQPVVVGDLIRPAHGCLPDLPSVVEVDLAAKPNGVSPRLILN
jgi:hypothetical protein